MGMKRADSPKSLVASDMYEASLRDDTLVGIVISYPFAGGVSVLTHIVSQCILINAQNHYRSPVMHEAVSFDN